ncbi:MAG: copper amine oxidase N-terminal domain-containing protein [Clostridia bacterium]|nr:copper amine oxidase N-terminal domain-containing protein [Clostridia bacterium]
MKKYAKKIVSFALVVMMAMTMFVPVFANGEISVYLDNEKVQFDVAPLLVNGRTMVPMRAIFEKLGAVVYWDDITRTAIAQKGNVNVSISIDDATLYKNGEPIVLDVPAQLNGGRTLVPLRAVSEAFECDVQWDGDTQTVNIYNNKNYKQIQEAVTKLTDWININYNNDTYYKEYTQEIGNYYFTVYGDSLSCSYFSLYDGNYNIHIMLSASKYSGVCSMEKEKNFASGKILNSSASSNQLELTYDNFESDYTGDKEIILDKFDKSVEGTLIVFDNFLKEINIGLTLKDFGFECDFSEKSLQQSIAFEELRDFILYYQETKNSDKAEMVRVYENSNGSTQYSMLYDDKKDVIRLTNTRIYRGSYTYISIDLTPDNQVYECSFYFAKSKSSTPDFEATYIIDAKTFGEKSNIHFEKMKGNKSNANSYKEVAKLMSLDMLDYLDWVFSSVDYVEFSTNDFGFNLK